MLNRLWILLLHISCIGGFVPQIANSTGTDETNIGIEKIKINALLTHRLAVFPDNKLAFCLIEKVANTAFSKIFSTIPKSNSTIKSTKRYNMWQRHCPLVYGYSSHDIANIYRNTSWTKAVFYRDPISRFISACDHDDATDKDGKRLCRTVFGTEKPTFEQAIRKILYKGMKPFRDPHFARQSDFCGGLVDSLQFYDEMHLLQPHTTREHFLEILHKAHVELTDKLMTKLDLFIPEVSYSAERFSVNASHLGNEHFTNSADEDMQLKYLTDDCYIRALVDYYKLDYELFGLRFAPYVEQALANTDSKACKKKLFARRSTQSQPRAPWL